MKKKLNNIAFVLAIVMLVITINVSVNTHKVSALADYVTNLTGETSVDANQEFYTATFNLQNLGDENINRISINDNQGTSQAIVVSLAPGESFSIPVNYTLQAIKDYNYFDIQMNVSVTFDNDEVLNQTVSLSVPVITITEEEENVDIPYTTIETEDDTLDVGTTIVDQEGINGEEIVTYKVTYLGDEIISKEEINRDRIIEPVDKIVRVGTKVIDVKTETYTEEIPFNTETIEDKTLDVGTTIVDQEGVVGEATITVEITYENGIEISRKEISRVTTKEPIDKIIRVGTKVIDVKTETYTEEIPFNTETIEDKTLDVGTTIVDQEGMAGESTITIEITYENGIEISRKEISRVTTKEPIDKIIRIGIKVIDVEPLKEMINYANLIDLSLYSTNTVQNLKIALSKANSVLAHPLSNDEILDATNNLRLAINNLKSYKVNLEVRADLQKVSARTKVNVLAVFTNAGTEDISNLVITDSIGLERNVGLVLAGESKIFNLSYTLPAILDGDTYVIDVNAIATYADGLISNASDQVSFEITNIPSEELEKERNQDLIQNYEEVEKAEKHDLPVTGEHTNLYLVITLCTVGLALTLYRLNYKKRDAHR